MKRARYEFDMAMHSGDISVILPSRKRGELLHRSLGSLRETCDDPGKIEYVIAFDDDDPQAMQALGEFSPDSFPYLYAIKGPRLGWKGLHEYYARCIKKAQGEWIVMWGDDGIMHTDGWDEIIREQKPGVLHVQGGPAGGHNVYPAVHRQVIEAVEYVIPSPHTDTWWTEVAKGAGCLYQVPIQITEDRFNETGNNNDETFREGSVHQYRQDEYYSIEFSNQRLNDTIRLAGEAVKWQ